MRERLQQLHSIRMKPVNATSGNRLQWITGAVIIVGAVVIARLFYLQVVKATAYDKNAEKQYAAESQQTFDRGTIYFTTRSGTTVAAATIQHGFKLVIDPRRITDPQALYRALAAVIPLNEEKFFTSAGRTNDPYEEIATHLSPEDADAIRALALEGVQLYPDTWRFYPGGNLAAKVIGFVSYKGDTLEGSYGLERFYNDTLVRSSPDLATNFFATLFANVQPTVFAHEEEKRDVITTIEPTVQTELEAAVSKVRSTWNSDIVGAIVMDPSDGSIVAMAQTPTFDLNAYGDVSDVSVYANPLVQNVYEMGSIIKPIVMASALDAGAVTPQTTYRDSGSVVVNDRTIYNFDKIGRGVVDMQEVLNQSLNTGMVFVQGKLGKERFKEYLLDRFQIGERTGVDLPGEVRGLVGNLSDSNSVNYANAAFGQGIATTPLSIVRSFAVLANGGYLVTPHVTQRPKDAVQEKGEAIISPETVATIGTMLTKVVDEGYHRGLPQYTVAAKTGTAQVARPGGLGYYDDRNLHSLIGYFPAAHPRFVVYFFNYYPKNGGQFAIQTLADPFFSMIEFLGNYYEITPDRSPRP